MKVGDYVRTKKGTIYQFNSTSSKALSGVKKYMVKSSPNIIDLIEVGDYVNGYPVEEVYQPINKEIGKLIKFSTDNVSGWEYEAEEITETDIKSIVTKEQFESMEYKVGE